MLRINSFVVQFLDDASGNEDPFCGGIPQIMEHGGAQAVGGDHAAAKKSRGDCSFPLAGVFWFCQPSGEVMLMTSCKPVRQVLGFLETLSWLQLKLLLGNPRKALAFSSPSFRLYMMLAGRGRWRSVMIDELLPGSERCEVRIVHLEPKGLSTAPEELVFLALLTRHLKPSHIFEIGTFHGRTALHFALNSPPECKVYTLDLLESERVEMMRQANEYDARLIQQCQVGLDYAGTPAAEKIEQLRGNSMTFDFSPYFGRMDLVFIDGSHHYPAVRSDTVNALKMARPGGLVVWHDFANYGAYHDVTRAVLELVPGNEVLQIANSQLAVYRVPGKADRAGTP